MGAVYDKYYKEVYKDACDVAAENFDGYMENNSDLMTPGMNFMKTFLWMIV